MDEYELPMVISGRQLLALDVDGRPCETCDEPMSEHEWVLMNPEGFVIFCSNLTFNDRGHLEVYSSRKYGKEGTWEDQDFVHIPTGSKIDPKGVALKEHEKFEKDKTQIFAQVTSARRYVFLGNRTIHMELRRDDSA